MRKSSRYTDIYNTKNYLSLSDEERKIVSEVGDFFKDAESIEGSSQTSSIEAIFTLFDNILNYPYEDEHRILNLNDYPDNKVLHLESTMKLLEAVGFENGSSSSILLYPYDRDLSRILLALETLITKISLKIEELSSVKVDSYMSFPFFQRYSDVLGENLKAREYDEKLDLKIKREEAEAIYEQTGCLKLEDYIIELGENSEEFQKVLIDILGPYPRTNQFLTIIREMWVEWNVLRQTVVYLRQCFADPVSRAHLVNVSDKNSKLARGIACISIAEASGIKQGTRNTITSLEEWVYLFIERETYRWQKFNEGIKKVDKELEEGFDLNQASNNPSNQDPSKRSLRIEKFWEDVKTFIVERLWK